MFVFELPEIGEGVVEGEIVSWLVKPGDVVAEDQPVCEVMTDKATVELSTPRGGRVVRLHAQPGDVVKVHSALVDIDDDGAAALAPSPVAPSPVAPSPVAPSPAPAPRAPAPPPVAPPAPSAAREAEAPAPGGKVLAAPAVRRHAREVGVELGAVAGTGKDGRVTRADVDRTAAAPEPEPMPVAPAAVPQVQAVATGREERIRIIGLRRKIAEQMVRAKHTAPHYTYVEEVDVTELVRLRADLKELAASRGVKLTYLPLIAKALCVVFREFPNVNAVVEEDPLTLVVKGDVNLGFACDTPQGLFVPVVHNCEQKSVLQIAAEVDDLTTRTRAGKARLHELQGGTFTLTSVGNIGGVFATPILNSPEVAILGVNRIVKRPMVLADGSIAARDMMYLSPSFDHRIIDGAVGARFVAALKLVLETPTRLLLELV